MAKKPLSNAIKAFYGLGDFGFGLMTSVETYFFVYFLTNVAKFPLPWVAAIGSASAIGDAILSPVYGGIIASVKPLRWGRNRSWMVIMPPLVVVTYIFMYTKIGNDITAAVIIVVAFVVSHIFWNLGWVANVNLIPTLANNPQERGLLSSRRAMFTSLAQMSFSYIGAPLIAFYGVKTGSSILGYPMTAGTMALVMMITYLIIVRLTVGYEETAPAGSADSAAAKEKVVFSDLIKSVTQNPHLIFLLIGDFFRYMSTFIYSTAVAFYFSYVAQNMGLMSLYILVASAGQFVGATVAGPLSKKLSQRTLALCCLFGAGITMIIGKFIGISLAGAFVCGTLSRVFVGSCTSSVVALYPEAAIYSEWKTGRNAMAFIMGIMNLSLKTAVISRGIVIPIVLSIAGFVSGLDPSLATIEIKNGVLNVFMFIPGLVMLISCAILFMGFRLNSEKVEQLQKEINERKDKNFAQPV
jgi:GPH family glycoside/pentoside/hexuronide:cation symporter